VNDVGWQVMAMRPKLALHDERLRVAPRTAPLALACGADGLTTVRISLEALAAGAAELHATVLTGGVAGPDDAMVRLSSAAAHVTVFKPLALLPRRLVLHPGQDYFVDWSGGPGGAAVEVRPNLSPNPDSSCPAGSIKEMWWTTSDQSCRISDVSSHSTHSSAS
jgi:hypothetical protein